MGAIRKLMSISTVGLVDMRSDKERIAAYTRQARNEARRQTRVMRAGNVVAATGPVGPPVTAAAPGWYPNPDLSGSLRWFDGARWTEHTSPAATP